MKKLNPPIKVTWPSGKTRLETSYPSTEALIAGMFVNGKKPDDVKVELVGGTVTQAPPPVSQSPTVKSTVKPAAKGPVKK